MALNWAKLRSEHVERACELISTGQAPASKPSKSLFVHYQGKELPAKHVLRIAYLLAEGQDLDTKIRFSSGEGTINRLRALGFIVERAQGGEAKNDA